MNGAVVVRIAKGVGGAPWGTLQPTAAELGFVPEAHESWSDAGRRVRVDAWWPNRDLAHRRRWSRSDREVAFLIGAVHGRRPPDPPSTPQTCSTTRGTFIAGRFDAEGRGWVSADPFGLRCLYVGENDAVLALGSRAALVAAGIGDSTRDPRATSVLAHTSHWVGHETGFAAVRLGPERHYLEVDGGTDRPARWLSHPALPPSEHPAASGAPTIIDELIVGLGAALERDATSHVIQLTGGRDSRMLLACALAGGIADRFEYQTAGLDDHPDVVIAQALCRRYGLRHQSLFVGMRSPEPFADRARSWVEGTGGMISAWEVPGRSMTDVRITGVGGELVRSFRTVEARSGDARTNARSVLARARPGRLGLVNQQTHLHLQTQLEEALDQGDGDVMRRIHLFYARNRMRFTRFGPRLEIETEQRIAPFVSPAIQAAALATDGTERQSGLLCVEVIRATAPDLLAVPFAAHPWDQLARSRLPPPPPERDELPPGAAHAPSITPSPPPTGSLVAELFATASEGRAGFVRSSLADPENPLWQALDREVARAAASRWDDLHLVERRELMGAVSAALWATI